MPYFYNGQNISGRSFIIGDTAYPDNWLAYSTQTERDALGITWQDDPPPPPPEPVSTVSMRQARLQLVALGLYDHFLAALATMPQAAQVEAEYAATVDRANPLTAAMVQLFGWSTQEADDYFNAASLL